MSWFTLHFAGGSAFFSGAVMLLGGLALTMLRGGRARVLAWVAGWAGVLFIALSATPLPWWSYAVWAAASLTAFLANTLHAPTRARIVSSAAAVVLSSVVVIAEARHRVRPDVPVTGARTLYVIGDSLSAGVGNEAAPTWPELIRSQRGVDVVNLARDGATAGSALRAMDAHSPLRDGLVVLEIGGNDQFGRTPTQEFSANLAKLLKRVSGPGRVLVMFELPLLPLNNAYGRIQRRLAAEYGVALIPKRYLVDVVSPADATTDGVHLTAAGHRRMAETVWSLIGPAFPAG